MKPVRFIAEIGNNHQGNPEIAMKMCRILCDAGVWGVKSQIRDIESHPEWKERIYDNPHSFGKTYYDHRKALELPPHVHMELRKYCESQGVEFFSSVWDIVSAHLLAEIGSKTVKIPSCYATWTELLDVCKKRFDRIIISTGMTSSKELDDIAAWANNAVLDMEVVIMLCTSSYPCAVKDVHLALKRYYKNKFSSDIAIGISGHYKGLHIDYGAYGMGCEYIERHVTFDNEWKGSDHAASIEIHEVMGHIRALNKIYLSYGDPNFEKQVLPSEVEPRKKLKDK